MTTQIFCTEWNSIKMTKRAIPTQERTGLIVQQTYNTFCLKQNILKTIIKNSF